MLAAAGLLLILQCADAAPPSAEQLRSWLRELDAEDFAAREEAGRSLVSAGEAAIEVLAGGVGSASPEMAWRANAALEQIALGGDERTLNKVAAALESLQRRDQASVGALVKGLRTRQAEYRRERAVNKIAALGGRLVGEGDAFLAGAMPVLVIPDIEELQDLIVAEEHEARVDEAVPDDGDKKEEVPDPAPPPEAPPLPDESPFVAPIQGAIEVAIADAFVGDFVEIDGPAIDAPDGQLRTGLILDANWTGGDAGLKLLRDLDDVATVTIVDAPLTDSALAHIAALPRLRELSVQGKVEFTATRLMELRRERPGLRIFARGEGVLGVNANLDGPCVLTNVMSGSGAEAADLVPGDEIVGVDEWRIRDFSDLTIAVFTHQPGDFLSVAYRRNGELKRTEVTLKERKALEAGRP
jgi:hypothetical protein